MSPKDNPKPDQKPNNNISKNKDLKIIIFSLIGLVILGLTIVLLKLAQEPNSDGDKSLKDPQDLDLTTVNEPANVETIFTALTSEDVTSVYIENKFDEGYTILKGDNGFYAEELSGLNLPYSAELLNNLTTYVSGLKSKQTVEENVVTDEDLDKYGLLYPKATVNAKFADGSKIAFIIGDDAPRADSAYFMLTGEEADNNVYAVATYLLNYFQNDRYHWLERKVMPDYNAEVSPTVGRVTINRLDLDEPITIEALPEVPLEETRTVNSHKMVSPFGIELDQEKSAKIIYGLFGLTARKAVYAGLNETDYLLTGLEDPTCEVEVRAGGRIYSLTLGNPADKDEFGNITAWYGMCGEVPDIMYVFDAASVPWIYATPENMMSETFLMPYVYSVKRLVVEADGLETLNFDISGDASDHEIIFNDKTLLQDGQRRFTDFYQFLISAKGESVFLGGEEQDQTLLARVTYSYNDPDFPDDVIEYYDCGDRTAIINLNGVNVYKTNYMYVSRLIENMEAFVKGGAVKQEW